MTTDYTELLNQTASEAKRPPSLPGGTYLARVKGIPDNIKSRQKQTPGLEFIYQYIQAGADVDTEMLAESEDVKPLSERTIRDTVYLTPDSMWRLTEVFKKLGLDTERSHRECLADVPNCEVVLTISQQPSQREPGHTYNQIEDMAEASTFN